MRFKLLTVWRTRRQQENKPSSLRLVLALIICAIGSGLLIWNEMEAVGINKIVTSMIDDIHKIKDVGVIDKQYDKSLVYIHGYIEVEEPLTEPEYGLSVPAVVLKRRVQMYQWVERTEEKSGIPEDASPFEVYYYDTEWRDKLVDSSKFVRKEGHENPKEFPISSHIYYCPHVKIGAYTLSSEIKRMFKDFTLITSDERPERHDIKMHSGLYYHTMDVWNPKVGDIRLQFSYAGNLGEAVSIIATQTGKELGGQDLLLLAKGKVSPGDMISNEHNWNMWLVRLYRVLGWLCLYIGSTFAKAYFYNFAKKHKKAYLLFSLDRRLSPYASVSSSVMAVIVCTIWTLYKPVVGSIMIILFLSPFVWCSSSLEAKKINIGYKKI